MIINIKWNRWFEIIGSRVQEKYKKKNGKGN